MKVVQQKNTVVFLTDEGSPISVVQKSDYNEGTLTWFDAESSELWETLTAPVPCRNLTVKDATAVNLIRLLHDENTAAKVSDRVSFELKSSVEQEGGHTVTMRLIELKSIQHSVFNHSKGLTSVTLVVSPKVEL